MELQVQSLKVLASCQVVLTHRLDFSTFFNSTTKDKLVGLDRLEGEFRIQHSRITVEELYEGKTLISEDWDCLGNRTPFRIMVKFLEGADEFSINE